MYPGPCLNQKLSTSLLHSRFGEKLFTYDLRKAFNQISLGEEDSNRLLFLWYKDVMKGDLSLIAYRNIRLSFGLRASPAILVLSLYRILCLDCIHECDQIVKLKKTLVCLDLYG